jgi:superfamily II DNA/RNA helicase
VSKKTINGISESIVDSLKRYIRSQYNISDPFVIRQRDALLKEEGLIQREPYIESTPKYVIGDTFSTIDIPNSFKKIISELSTKEPKIIFDPPYSHQLDSVRNTLVENKSSIIMTGTGSGKTESFLWPILGKLSKEADESPSSFEHEAVRALVLYPMNALVNDQLGRMRSLFGDARIKDIFRDFNSKRIPRFARYTSRTPYPGKRDKKKDKDRFQGYKEFFIDIEDRKNNEALPDADRAKSIKIFNDLKKIGKWPAKESMMNWYYGGQSENKSLPWGEEGKRLKTADLDSELLTRHEIHTKPPDLLVTNFSMLSYMMLRPIEKNIFHQTSEWLKNSPKEKFIIVFDEAHLYTGSQGAEVSLLVRRLINRLKIKENQLQIIITSASFSDKERAIQFASQLTSLDESQFEVFVGEKDKNEDIAKLDKEQLKILSDIDLELLENTENPIEKLTILKDFLTYRNQYKETIESNKELRGRLYNSLKDFPPLNKIINKTMGNAITIDEMIDEIFPSTYTKENSERVLTTLLSLAAFAKDPSSPRSLFPSRLHLFLRGIPGLWACLNQKCNQIDVKDHGNVIGKLYSQPIEQCDCGSKVYEYYTCRYCGSDFAKAFIDDVDNANKKKHPLWSSSGDSYISEHTEYKNQDHFREFDILLKEIGDESIPEKKKLTNHTHELKLAEFDPIASRLNPDKKTDEVRDIIYAETTYITGDARDEKTKKYKRIFLNCPVCNESHYKDQDKSPVQNHQTKGVEPLKAIAGEIINTQTKSKPATSENPLGGRKILFFSDSREKAASLVKRFNDFGAIDTMRPMIAIGYKLLQENKQISKYMSLDDIYTALLLGSKQTNVRLRFNKTPQDYFKHEDYIFDKILSDPPSNELFNVFLYMKAYNPDPLVIPDLIKSIMDSKFGLYPLAIAQLREKESDDFTALIEKLEDLPGLAETDEEKKHLVRIWLYCWAIARNKQQRRKPWFNFMIPEDRWWQPPEDGGYYIVGYKRNSTFKRLGMFLRKFNALQTFERQWREILYDYFAKFPKNEEYKRLDAGKLSLCFAQDHWGICNSCRSVQVKSPRFNECVDCDKGKVEDLNPATDKVFIANNEYARKPVMDAINKKKETAFSYRTKEHTAQLNATSMSVDVFSEAETNELSFQDVDYDEAKERVVSTDILSSTTTMEVGIDIGALSAVGLRGMPPARSNYQQRSGRAGRRGNSVAIVVSWGNVDSHDEHYFSHPREMISGEVKDPFINLKNKEITERHIISFLFERYIEDLTMEELKAGDQLNVFSFLGSVTNFRNNENSPITLKGLKEYITNNQDKLIEELRSWLPNKVQDEFKFEDFDRYIETIKKETDDWEIFEKINNNQNIDEVEIENILEPSVLPDSDERIRGEKATYIDPKKNELLTRLVFKGVLPKYGFPFDVVGFHVFDKNASHRNRYKFKYQPTTALSAAIKLYAPGECTTIGGNIYQTHGIYSINAEERKAKYNQSRTLYYECSNCGYSKIDRSEVKELKGKKTNEPELCINCDEKTFGPPKWRLEPVGFVHSIHEAPLDNYDIKPANKGTNLRSNYSPEEDKIIPIGESSIIRMASDRGMIEHTNPGPNNEGYDYCTECGRTSVSAEKKLQSGHDKPYPDEQRRCDSNHITRNMTLGTEYITDILWIHFNFVDTPIFLKPGRTNSKIVLTTVAHALSKAATQILEVSPNEISAIYRHETSDEGLKGDKAEIILFDTLANGAGYSSSPDLCKEELIITAINILENCPEKCDSSCYRCLRNYHNKYDHQHLDRYLGQLFLETALNGTIPNFKKSRIDQALKQIKDDCEKYGFKGDIEINKKENIDGDNYIIPLVVTNVEKDKTRYTLTNPLTRSEAFDHEIKDWIDTKFGDIERISELEVKKSLPSITQRIVKREND